MRRSGPQPHMLIRGAIFLAGASMGCALALEEGRASEVKILGNCRPCFLLWIQNADVAKNEESQGE